MGREKDDWTFLWLVTGPSKAWAVIVAAGGSNEAERIAKRLGGEAGSAAPIGVAVRGIAPGNVLMTEGLGGRAAQGVAAGDTDVPHGRGKRA
jgi:hypothetical protein